MKYNKLVALGAFTCMVVSSFAACGKNSKDPVLPTLAPTPTEKPVGPSSEGPTPTPRPDAKNTTIFDLNGEDFNQTSVITVNSGKVEIKKVAYAGEYSFQISGREDSSQGSSFNFTDLKGTRVNVVGKKIHFAAWVYQETGSEQSFRLNLSMKRMDNTSAFVSVNTVNVPDKTWTLVESEVEIPSNCKNPSLSLYMDSSADDYYFDDIRITYDPASSVAADASLDLNAVEALYFNFEDDEVHFTSRGTGVGTIAFGGVNDGKCVKVTGRTQNWNGIELDLSSFNFGGKKLYVDFMAKHENSEQLKVNCTVEVRVSGSENATYSNVGMTESMRSNTWTKGTGVYEVPEDVENIKLYFETGALEDFYMDNILISVKSPDTIDFDGIVTDANGVVSITENKEKIDTSSFTVIHKLSGDNANKEIELLRSRGSAKLQVTNQGHHSYGFLVSGRTAAWNGVGIDFTNINGKSFDVIGKEIFVSFWVYQESGETVEFNGTLQVTKPDGGAAWPERVGVTSLPSGKWTYVEGIIPVYANITMPQINFEIPGHDTADFVLDDITIMVNENSKVPDRDDYIVKAKAPFTGISLAFEDNNAYFQTRGNGKPSIVNGGHESAKCMKISGRSSSWHGVQADLSEYDLAGKTIKVSYWLYHEYEVPISVAFTAQQNDGTNETYTPVVAATEVQDGKWVQFTGTFTFDSNAKKYYLYFESPSETAEFYVDDVVIELMYE